MNFRAVCCKKKCADRSDNRLTFHYFWCVFLTLLNSTHQSTRAQSDLIGRKLVKTAMSRNRFIIFWFLRRKTGKVWWTIFAKSFKTPVVANKQSYIVNYNCTSFYLQTNIFVAGSTRQHFNITTTVGQRDWSWTVWDQVLYQSPISMCVWSHFTVCGNADSFTWGFFTLLRNVV